MMVQVILGPLYSVHLSYLDDLQSGDHPAELHPDYVEAAGSLQVSSDPHLDPDHSKTLWEGVCPPWCRIQFYSLIQNLFPA